MFRGFNNVIEKNYINKLLNYDFACKSLYNKGDIFDFSLNSNMLYVIVCGDISINSVDEKSSLRCIANLSNGDIFSNMNILCDNGIIFMCNSDVEIVAIDYNSIFLNRDALDSDLYKFMIDTINSLISTNINLMQRISIISNKSTEKKLISFFKINSKKNFCTLSISYTELADYLCVDRSSMMRTLANMEKKGLIKRHGRRVVIVSKK